MYTLFIVDDREIFRRQFKRFPVFQGNSRFQIRFEAQNGQEALEILRREHVDIMITDIRMPIMDGLELLQKTQEESLCPCVILLSEYADFSYAKQGIVLGAFDYVIKPVDQDALEELLNRSADYLDSLAQGIGGSNNVSRILPALVLKNDEYAETVARQVAARTLEAHRAQPEKLWSSLEQMVQEMHQQTMDTSAHMERFCNFAQLFALDRTTPLEEVEEYFCAKVGAIRQELNKFAVDSKSELIQSVCNTVVKNIENNLSLRSVAKLHFVNKAYLSHLFKQEIGINFVDFLTCVKMERAKAILSTSDQKIYEISTRLGYSDTEYFRRVFKQYTGGSATEYRQSSARKELGNNA